MRSPEKLHNQCNMIKVLSLTRTPLNSSLRHALNESPNKLRIFQKEMYRWKSYRAAILEEYDKPLIVTQMKNDTPVGPGMVIV